MTAPAYRPAPEWETERWFNAPAPLSLADLRGRVVVVGAFQMLCPGCVQTLIPQLQQVHTLFDPKQVAVIGLHTVFEHHAAMTPVALEAFLHEYRVGFPVGVDRAGERSAMPQTMARYAMQGTPTLILIDMLGRLRMQRFGHEPDLRLGASIMKLVDEGAVAGPLPTAAADASPAGVCTPDGCT